MLLLVVLIVSTSVAYIHFNNIMVLKVLWVSSISLFVLITFVLIHIKFKYKSLKQFIFQDSIISSLEHNLIQIEGYEKIKNTQLLNVPLITVENDTIIVDLTNIRIRKKIETYADMLSTALPNSLVTTNYYFSEDSANLVIEFEDSRKNNRLVFISLQSFISYISKFKKTEFLVDHKHNIDLIENPHWLISGGTGSGKTYLTQNLLLEAISKGFQIVILDVKRSYHAFNNLVDRYETEPSSIVEALEDVRLEMRKRQSDMEIPLSTNPRALAIDIGFKPMIVIIEEYIGLTSTLESKEAKRLESIVKEISVLARSVNISLFIILQSANTENINSSLRHNLNKILLGEAQSNIMVATFGNGVEIPKISRRMLAGEGYIQINGRIEQLKVPQVNYTINELKNIGRSNQP